MRLANHYWLAPPVVLPLLCVASGVVAESPLVAAPEAPLVDSLVSVEPEVPLVVSVLLVAPEAPLGVSVAELVLLPASVPPLVPLEAGTHSTEDAPLLLVLPPELSAEPEVSVEPEVALASDAPLDPEAPVESDAPDELAPLGQLFASGSPLGSILPWLWLSPEDDPPLEAGTIPGGQAVAEAPVAPAVPAAPEVPLEPEMPVEPEDPPLELKF